nr:capsid protein [Bovine gammaherpesvirus 4]
MNPTLGSSITVHPTSSSIQLFEILQGKYSYVKGQTLHSSLRHPGVFSRQLFVHLYKTALSSCCYDDVITDWQKFEQAVACRWGKTSVDLGMDFRWSTFESWSKTLKMALNQILLSTIYQILHVKTAPSYEKYVDWVVAIGLVPICKQKPCVPLLTHIQEMFSDVHKKYSEDKTISRILYSLQQELISVVKGLTSIYIPDFSEVTIEFIPHENKYIGIYKHKQIPIEEVTRPVIFKNNITFDSPVQRLLATVMSCHRTTEHAKLCQLLNTSPMKSIQGSSSNTVYKELLEQIEKSSQKSDPKKELLQLLIKLAENKTISGVTDVVEDFISDVSNNIVDKNKLFGNQKETTTQGLRKHVSNSVFKCLTNQINEQFDTIHNLEREKEIYLKRFKEIESQLDHALREEHVSTPPVDILTSDTLKTLAGVHELGLGMMSSSISKGNTVQNSFFSQYVPPFRDQAKDLTSLWESEIFQTYKLTPVVDNQGHRLYVRYTQDTISILLGPFTYVITKMKNIELINDTYSFMSLDEIGDDIYQNSRLCIYINDIGRKYSPRPSSEYEGGVPEDIYKNNCKSSINYEGHTSNPKTLSTANPTTHDLGGEHQGQRIRGRKYSQLYCE